jgi:peroxiredoxin
MKAFAVCASLVLLAATSGAMAGEKATIGQQAPGFTLADSSGKDVSLSEYRGKIVVLEWFNPGCPVTVRHARSGTMKELVTRYQDREVVLIGINSTAGSTHATNQKAIEQYSLNYPLLNDSEGAVGRAYDAKTTPHMYIIDKSGKLVYAGAIDDDPNGGKADRTNHVQKALDEVLAGKAVSTAETRPYGCAVKYR